MQTTNKYNQLNVLTTRPSNKTQALVKTLATLNIACVNQPLFDYQPLAALQESKYLLTSANTLIFVSVAAAEFANAHFSADHWQCKQVLAVGKATQKVLQAFGVDNVICPSQENSEGLLDLPHLKQPLNNTNITIVRGDGGREHLANTLIARGGKVTYLESYQKVWRLFPKDISKQWYQQQINCIVVTSNAILEQLAKIILTSSKQNKIDPITDYWQNKCLWIVASKRISDKAKQLGLVQVVISDGASEQAITATLQQFDKNSAT